MHMQHLLDYVARPKYRVTYLMRRTWWLLRRPTTYTVAVALWHEGKMLLIRTRLCQKTHRTLRVSPMS